MKKFKIYAVKILVFLALFRILLFFMQKIFGYIRLPDGYELIIQLGASGIMVLLALLLTSFLTRNDDDEVFTQARRDGQ
ncbi:hypothetical protein DFP94_11168 [Fontibacillus phaseoli]|uniref:Uncharacterized protein n=1 Tax=Fontibacillus phaseoli TaxID=1416533 RepID=A0A369B5K3_9BACL|nr:hypothetical protein [Fontibacillus phaseoli]RCX16721.1 hypothetical protein DFP94_11168 [Fontibacillus phaseoli]